MVFFGATERTKNQKGPDCPKEWQVETYDSRRPDNNLIQELSKNDDVEGGESIDFMRNVDSCGVPCVEEFLGRRRVRENPN